MNTSLDQSIDIKHYLRVVWRRKGLIVLCTVATLCSTLVGLRFVPKEYVSEVTVLFADRQPLVGQLERLMGGMTRPQDSGTNKQRLDHMIGRVKSRPFLEKVIRMLQMEQDPMIRQRATALGESFPGVSADELAIRLLVQSLQSRISFAAAGSGVYKIRVADYSPENAQLLARWISGIYVDTSIQSSLDYLRAAHDFGNEQQKIYEMELRQSEEALAAYRGSSIVGGKIGPQVHAGNVTAAEVLRQKLRDEVVTLHVRSKPFRKIIDDLRLMPACETLIQDADIADQIEGVRRALRDHIVSRLATGEAGAWPPQGSVEARKRELFERLEREVDMLYPDLTVEARDAVVLFAFPNILSDVHTEAGEFLNAAVGEFQRQEQSQPDSEIELARLEAEVAQNRRLLESFQAQLVASEVTEAMEATKLGGQIEILDPAELPLTPYKPNRRKILLAALMLGPIIGIGLTYVGELLDSTLRSLDDFRRVSPEPVLGTTPLLRRKVVERRGIRRYWIPATISFVVLLTIVFFMVGDPVVERVLGEAQPVETTSPEGNR